MPDLVVVTLWVSLGAAGIGILLNAIDAERHKGLIALLGLVLATGIGIVVYNWTGGYIGWGIGSFIGAGGGYSIALQRHNSGNV